MADDLERRAIIAAHDAECARPGECYVEVPAYASLTAREQAIVALWRADRDDYRGRYETSYASRMHAESLLDAMTREARLSRESTGKAVARAKRAEAAIQRVRDICAWVPYKVPGDPDSYSTYREGRSDLAGEVLAALDEPEATP